MRALRWFFKATADYLVYLYFIHLLAAIFRSDDVAVAIRFRPFIYFCPLFLSLFR